jgi:D-methionine transport system ATP-binding protein
MIEVSALTKRYGDLTVLDGIDFTVQTSEIAAIVGPSGAGKSTLARCINLLEQPTAGSIRVNGQNLTELSSAELRRARRAIGTVFQSAGLLARLTAADNVALPLRYLKLSAQERHERVRSLLQRVGMLHRANHYPSELSGGQRQRIGLARGLVLNPSVLLAELRDELKVAVVLITHEMDVVRSIADTVAQLDHGRIVERGAVADVVRRSDSTLSRALLPNPPSALTIDGAPAWQLRYAEAGVSPTWLSSISRELDTDISVLSGLIEAMGGGTAGRVVVRIDRPLPDEQIIAAFAARGIQAVRGIEPNPGIDDLATSALAGSPA